MGQRQGTILKKCKCVSQERCSHKWTLRYWADGRQREASFADELDDKGRPKYGSGKRLAQDAQLKIAHDKRARVFIDPKLGSTRFRDECEKWIARHPGTELTKIDELADVPITSQKTYHPFQELPVAAAHHRYVRNEPHQLHGSQAVVRKIILTAQQIIIDPRSIRNRQIRQRKRAIA